MELFPVFLFGIGFVFLGAAALTVYIAFKAFELP
jgi:hypothetical protein